MLIPTYTNSFREQELERGRRSLFYFGYSILGFTALSARTKKSQIADFHLDLCAFLEGRPPHHPWHTACVCCWRGAGKSTITTIEYPWWRGLYSKGFKCKIIENSSDNAYVNHFAPALDLFISSRRADYLQWLYMDPSSPWCRIPAGFEGWNKQHIKLLSDDPSIPFLSYWGLESKREGAHVDLVVLDDPEGADAEKGLAANEESFRAYQNAIPLLTEPTYSQILIVATPHGRRPLVWRLRKQENWKSEQDNARSRIKFFWRPILDGAGQPYWPDRFPLWYVEELLKQPVARQQYLLLEEASGGSLFDIGRVRESFYRYADAPRRSLLVYPAYTFDPDKLTEDGYVLPKPTEAVVNLRNLRFFIHFDPLHKSDEMRRTAQSDQRPAKAAIVVCGVGKDRHVFVLQIWTSDRLEINEQASKLFQLYCQYAPYRVTYESVGAQLWLKSIVVNHERSNPAWARPKSSPYLTGTSHSLPRMSTVLEESAVRDKKTGKIIPKTNQSKEFLFREVLSAWVNFGALHILDSAEQSVVVHQLDNAMNEDCEVDLVDCLAQGPAVWSGPSDDLSAREFMAKARRGFVDAFVDPVERVAAGAKSVKRRWGG